MGRAAAIAILTLAVLALAAAPNPCLSQEGPAASEQAVPSEGAGETASGEAAAEETATDTAELLKDETFHYKPAGKRDPFQSLLVLVEKKKDISELPPIQQFDVKGIKISGVVLDDAQGPRAMIKAPNGMTFVVKQGTIIGKNEGEVIEVTLQGIRVVEKYMDFSGNETLKEVFIKARPDQKQQTGQ